MQVQKRSEKKNYAKCEKGHTSIKYAYTKKNYFSSEVDRQILEAC